MLDAFTSTTFTIPMYKAACIMNPWSTPIIGSQCNSMDQPSGIKVNVNCGQFRIETRVTGPALNNTFFNSVNPPSNLVKIRAMPINKITAMATIHRMWGYGFREWPSSPARSFLRSFEPSVVNCCALARRPRQVEVIITMTKKVKREELTIFIIF